MSTKIVSPAGVARYLVGRRIVAVDLRPFSDDCGSGAQTTFDPHITLDDGSVLRFRTHETDSGSDYGIDMIRDPGR